LARVQVKTSTCRQRRCFQVQLATRGGNQSWSGVAKNFDPTRCDFLFVLVGDGRRWFIPSQAVEGHSTINLGGHKYSEYEIGLPPEQNPGGQDTGSRIAFARGSAGAGEPGRTVNPVALPEWVRFPPPPSVQSETDVPPGRARPARTRISPGHQITIPLGPFRAASLTAGDRLEVTADGLGRVTLTRIEDLIEAQESLLG
jgi:hypothetical protein